MTPQQLMLPRYRVIMDYPYSQFVVGSIIDDHRTDGWKYSDFPLIFQRIHWYKWRGKSELPEYVKFTWAGEIQEVEKIESWIRNDLKDDPYEEVYAFIFLFDGKPVRTALNDACVFSEVDGWFPATKEEYEQFKKK